MVFSVISLIYSLGKSCQRLTRVLLVRANKTYEVISRIALLAKDDLNGFKG